MPTSFDYLLTQAVSRIYLDNVDHIQSSWVTQGMKIGQVALEFGADDLGSIMIEENVVSAAGTTYRASTDDFVRTIRPRQDPGAARHALPRRPRLELTISTRARRSTGASIRIGLLTEASHPSGSLDAGHASPPGSPRRRVAARRASRRRGRGRAGPRAADAGRHLSQQVELTPHGPVAFTVITAPRADRALLRSGPCSRGGTISGPRASRDADRAGARRARSIAAGINGDFFSGADGHPERDRDERRPDAARADPRATRRSASTRTAAMHVGRISFAGTWKGIGQRRPLTGVNQRPRGNADVLFTPAWGPATPDLPNAVGVVLEPFPARRRRTPT